MKCLPSCLNLKSLQTNFELRLLIVFNYRGWCNHNTVNLLLDFLIIKYIIS